MPIPDRNPDYRDPGELAVPRSVDEVARQSPNLQITDITPPRPASNKLTDMVRDIYQTTTDEQQRKRRLDDLRRQVLRQEIIKHIEATRQGKDVGDAYARRAQWIDRVFSSPPDNWRYDPVVVGGADAPPPGATPTGIPLINSILEVFGVSPIKTPAQVAEGELRAGMVRQREQEDIEAGRPVPPPDEPLQTPFPLFDPETYLPVGTIQRIGQGIARSAPAAVVTAPIILRFLRSLSKRSEVPPRITPRGAAEVFKPPEVMKPPEVTPPTQERINIRVMPPTEEGKPRYRVGPVRPPTITGEPEADITRELERRGYSVVDDVNVTAPQRAAEEATERVRSGWFNPFRRSVTEGEQKGWQAAQQAWNTSGHLGPYKAEMYRREFAEGIPEQYWRPASQYLDTGDEAWLAQLPPNVRESVARFRKVTEEYKTKAVAGGLMDESQAIDDYFTHVIQGPTPALTAEARVRFAASLRPNSPYMKERRFPTLDELEQWLQASGLASLGVRVNRDPSTVMQAYVTAFHKAEGLQELGARLRTDLLKDGTRPALVGSDELAGNVYAGKYVRFDEPYFRKFVDGTPMVDRDYVEPLQRLKDALGGTGRGFNNKIMEAWDKINNTHRRLVMAMPWKHGLFNVGFDALTMIGVSHPGEWLKARGEGVRMIEEMAPFVQDLIKYGGVHIPVLKERMVGFRNTVQGMVENSTNSALRDMGAMVAEPLKKVFRNLDELTWEKMVGGWTVGMAKILFDRAEKGQFPASFLDRGITREAWNAMPYEQKMGAVGRVVGWVSGQMEEMVFKDATFMRNLRQVMFSPMWNASNIAITRAALDPVTKGTGGFAMRGLNDEQRRVVSSYMQAYVMRSMAYSYASTVLANMGTTLMLDGVAKGPWDNGEGFKARIYAGRDPDGRIRYAMSPLGYMAKDLGHFVTAMGGAFTEANLEDTQRMFYSKLAEGPRMAMEVGLGMTPYFRRPEPSKGKTAGDRMTDLMDYAVNTVFPLSVYERGDVAGTVMSGAGLFFRRPLTPSQVESVMNQELSKYNGQIAIAQQRGQKDEVKRLQDRQKRAMKEWNEELRKSIEIERSHKGQRGVAIPPLQ